VAEDEDDPLGRKPGEYLWNADPDYPYGDFLRAQREAQLPGNWSALFQGRPAPEEGDFFQASYFRPYTALPREQLTVYGACDYAVSEGRGDFTVHVVVGLNTEGQLYLPDCWRKQAAPDESISAFLDLVQQWRPIGWAVERGQLDNALEPFMREQQRKRNTYVAMEKFATRGDKTVRASSIRGRLATNTLLVPTQADWWPEVRAELLSFPAARHDDFCDALGLIGQILDKMFAPHAPVKKEPPKVLSLDPTIKTTVTMDDLWAANEKRYRRRGGRIY
jgi:predicted phage terminase large subunit-like protein